MTGNRRRDDLLNGNNDYSSKSDSAAGATGGLFGDANKPADSGLGLSYGARSGRRNRAQAGGLGNASLPSAHGATSGRTNLPQIGGASPAAGARPRYGGLPGGGGGGGGHGGGMGGHHAPGAAPLGAGPGGGVARCPTRTGTRAR